MILTTKGRYAVSAIIEIAANRDNQPISLNIISQRQKISLSYLEQIFAHLRKAGVVKSIKGPGGGYVLAKKSSEITVAEVIKAIGEPIKITRCGNVEKSCMATKTKCQTHKLWHGLENQIYQYLNSISLEEACK